jgi:hypothetical protein
MSMIKTPLSICWFSCTGILVYYFTVARLLQVLFAFLLCYTKEYINREQRGYLHHKVPVSHPTWHSPWRVHHRHVNQQPVTRLLTSQSIRLSLLLKNKDTICLSLCPSTLPFKEYCLSIFWSCALSSFCGSQRNILS